VEYALTYLIMHGLADTKRQFGETNGTMVEAEAATLRLQKAWMSFGETIDPILTVFKNAAAGTLEWASNAVSPETRDELNRQGMERLEEAQSDGKVSLGEFWKMYTQGIGSAFGSVFGGGSEEVPSPSEDFAGATPMLEDLTEEMQDAADEAATSGAAISTNLSAGIDEAAPLAVASTQSMVQQVQDLLDSVTVPDYAGMAAAGLAAAQGVTANLPPIVMQLNGRRVGQLITPYVSTQQAKPVG
jgi:hypothetical protein